MNKEELITYFEKHPTVVHSGSGKIALLTKSDRIDVLQARDIFRNTSTKYKKRIRNYKVQSEKKKNKFPRILIFDIETSPIKAYVWGTWKEDIYLNQIIDDWFVLCWSAKWLYSNDVIGDCLTSEEVLKKDDSRIVSSLWNAFNLADIIIAHNAKKFDEPRMNTRFIVNNLPPVKSHYIIDTLAIARKQFGFTSNKLDALAEYFNLLPKLDTDFDLWRLCMEGKQSALDYMFKYNKYDVELLELVYLKLRPWIKSHPNIGNYIDSPFALCSNCGSDKLELIKDEFYYTSVGKYQLYRCKKCGAITRGRKNLNNNKTSNTSIFK